MSELATKEAGNVAPGITYLTIDEQMAAYINSLVDAKIEKILGEIGGRFVTRQQIISEIGVKAYNTGVQSGRLIPIANEGRNAKVRVRRREYEAYIESIAMR